MTSMHLPPPPPNFRPVAYDEIQSVEWRRDGPLPFAAPRRRGRGAKAVGLRYDAHAAEHFARTSEGFAAHPWLRFITRNEGVRWAQPDGLLFDLRAGRITILEFKIRHTTDAWWQLRRLYEPLIRRLFADGAWHFACCEVCKYYDPAVRLPEAQTRCDNPARLYANAFGVHILS